MADTTKQATSDPKPAPHKHITLVIVLGMRKGQKPGAPRGATTRR